MILYCLKRTSLLYILLFLFQVVYAQEDVSFTADRPGATTGTDVMPKGRFQWETGFGYEKSTVSNIRIENWTINNSLFRYGVTDYAELRFQIDEMCTHTNDDSFGGIANLMIGTKISFCDGVGILPSISLMANLYIPGGKESNYLPQNMGASMDLLFNNELCSWISLGYQAGLSWYDNPKPTTFAGACLGVTPTKEFSFFIEEYNYFDDETECYMEVGASYLLCPRLQIDLTTDFDLRHMNNYHNLSFGIAWQITK